MSKWYNNTGKNEDVVVCSVIRLSRNLADAPYPSRMSKDIKKSVSKRIYATIKSSDFANEFELVNLSDVSKAKALSYAERMLISFDFAKNRDNSSFMLSNNENVSIMLCEEDHICISSFTAGQGLDSAYGVADKIDDALLTSLNIAFDEKFGFLTSSPVNIGTGLKASIVLHLPALAENNAIFKLSSMVGKLGLSLREMYKNGIGDLYVLSNQVTLGITEQGAIDNINAICDQIIKQERTAREGYKNSFTFEDKAYRTLGVLKMARVLDLNEFLNSLSVLRLGISLSYFDIDYSAINDMLFDFQDASVIATTNIEINQNTCAKIRAQLVREKLN